MKKISDLFNGDQVVEVLDITRRKRDQQEVVGVAWITKAGALGFAVDSGETGAQVGFYAVARDGRSMLGAVFQLVAYTEDGARVDEVEALLASAFGEQGFVDTRILAKKAVEEPVVEPAADESPGAGENADAGGDAATGANAQDGDGGEAPETPAEPATPAATTTVVADPAAAEEPKPKGKGLANVG